MRIINWAKERPKTIIATIFGFIALIALINLAIIFLKSAEVNILVAPYKDAVVSINGKHYKSGTYRLFPAKQAHIKIEAPDFETKEFDLELKGHQVTTIHNYLKHKEKGLNYYFNNKEDYKVFELVATDQEGIEYLNEIKRLSLVRDVLPLHYVYVLGIPTSKNRGQKHIQETALEDDTSSAECTKIVCIKMYNTTKDDSIARRLLSEQGFNYDDYEITTTTE